MAPTSAAVAVGDGGPPRLPSSVRSQPLAFVASGSSSSGIYLGRIGESSPRKLVEGPHSFAALDWAPDGSRLAFNADLDGDFDIWAVDPDGANLVNLTPDSPSADAEPRWSPDGTEIAFTSNRSGVFDLYLMKADGTDVRALVTGTTQISDVRWAPDGQRLAFTRASAGSASRSEIQVVNRDGTGLVTLTSTPTAEFAPRWSPDGKAILFLSQRLGALAVFVMAADGTAATRVSPRRFAATAAEWSPDGRRIAFVGQRVNRDEPTDVFVLRLGDRATVNLSRTLDYNERALAWSPDGKAIAFTAAFAGQERIFVTGSRAGATLATLGMNLVRDHWPAWQPPR
jgi:Tol biopolymer transport system component